MGCAGSTSSTAEAASTAPLAKTPNVNGSAPPSSSNNGGGGGKTRKKTIQELREATGTPSMSTPGKSAAAGAGGSVRASWGLSRSFRLDDDAVDEFARNYLDAIAPKDQYGKDVPRDALVEDCMSLFKEWPRGEGPGELLSKPVPLSPEHTPIAARGVKVSWLLAAWSVLKNNTKKMFVPTRAFVEHFVRPLLRKENATAFLELVPPAFRAAPHAYMCHAWDGWLRQVLFLSDLVTREWPADSAVWIDVFALPQKAEPNGSNALALVEQTKDTIAAIKRTLVVLPGDGHDRFAVLPLYRSWCLFEIAMTPPGALQSKIGLHGDLGDVDFHKRVADRILSFTWGQAVATLADDKRVIDQFVSEKLEGGAAAGEATVRALCHDAFQQRYANVTSPVQIKSGLGRYSSLSDVYNLDRNSLRSQADARESGDGGSSAPGPQPDF